MIIPVLMFLACTGSAQTALDLTNPPASPQLLPAGWINTGFGERDFALSPDGNELFYTLQLPQGIFQTMLYSKKDAKGNWSKPEVAPFAGNFSDLEPAFTADGKKLYFSSNRPLSGNEVKDFDIWTVEKDAQGKWGLPQNIGAPVNTPADEFYPSIAKSGNLYFTAAYAGGVGKEDIYKAEWKDGRFATPAALDSNVNSKTFEFNAFVSPDESFVIYTSHGRKGDVGGDLYISIKDGAGNWQPSKKLAMLNSTKLDYCPFVSFDKKILFFTSDRSGLQASFPDKKATYQSLHKILSSPQNGGGDIYWVSFDKVLESVK